MLGGNAAMGGKGCGIRGLSWKQAGNGGIAAVEVGRPVIAGVVRVRELVLRGELQLRSAESR